MGMRGAQHWRTLLLLLILHSLLRGNNNVTVWPEIWKPEGHIWIGTG